MRAPPCRRCSAHAPSVLYILTTAVGKWYLPIISYQHVHKSCRHCASCSEGSSVAVGVLLSIQLRCSAEKTIEDEETTLFRSADRRIVEYLSVSPGTKRRVPFEGDTRDFAAGT